MRSSIFLKYFGFNLLLTLAYLIKFWGVLVVIQDTLLLFDGLMVVQVYKILGGVSSYTGYIVIV